MNKANERGPFLLLFIFFTNAAFYEAVVSGVGTIWHIVSIGGIILFGLLYLTWQHD